VKEFKKTRNLCKLCVILFVEIIIDMNTVARSALKQSSITTKRQVIWWHTYRKYQYCTTVIRATNNEQSTHAECAMREQQATHAPSA
jgi:hypothetical protein